MITDDEDKNYQPCWVNIEGEFTLWKGNWNSSNFDTAHGTIEIPLKENNNGEYDVDAVITYHGCYNSGKRVTFLIHVNSTSVETLNKQVVTYLEFVGYVGDQKIEYSISDYKPNRIIGIYKSYGPDDVGNIELYPTKNRRTIDYGTGNKQGSNWCVIG